MNSKKTLVYISNSINLFGIIDGMKFSFHFFLSHFMKKNDGSNKKCTFVGYYPSRLVNKGG